jgi:hypothetical protein
MYNVYEVNGLNLTDVYFRKHECHICGENMHFIKSGIYVKKDSEEAFNWDFSPGGTIIMGDGYFITFEFLCPNCGFLISESDFSIWESEIYLKWPNYYKPKSAIKYLNYVEPSYFYKSKQKKKRYCPDCGKKMLSTYTYEVIEPDSPEAKDYDFTIAGKKIEGRIEFRKGFFFCPNKKCGKEITFDEMREIEGAKAKE